MAQQKRSTATRSAGRKTTRRTSSRRPIRREVGGFVCLLFFVLTAASYFSDAIVLHWVACAWRGLFGYGYYFALPALGLASWILLFHRGRPVAWQTTTALLLPLFGGAMVHTISCVQKFTTDRLLPDLWESGLECISGGVLSGLLSEGGKVTIADGTTIVLLAVFLLICLFVSLRIKPSDLVTRWKEREVVLYEPEQEPAPKTASAPVREPRRATPQIDIPLDGEEKKRSARKVADRGFFKGRDDSIPTPDEVLRAEERKDAPEPLKEPATEKLTAAEVNTAAAEVARDIENTEKETASDYEYPPIVLLDEGRGTNAEEAGRELRSNAQRLAETLRSFNVEATSGDVVRGPSVTRYEFTLEHGVKLSKVTNLQDDIALALGATGVRIAPIPDKLSVVGIEVPNKTTTAVAIRDVIESREFTAHKSKVAFAVGKDISGTNIVGNIEKLPHVLIAGTTGSGKSVCMNSLIVSLLYKAKPDEVRFIMVDPKMVELAPYNGIPHLLIPVVTDPKKAAGALQWAVYEMMKRYRIFSDHGVKNLEGYNALAAEQEELEKMPSIVVMIDELADLMLVAAKEVEESICRVAQMGRAAGVHLVIATQRPSVDVITGLMKANIPSRIAFAVASSLESRIILDTAGAEKLIGKGDMLYAPLGDGKPKRVQGCFISPEEIDRVVSFVKEAGESNYDSDVIDQIEKNVAESQKGGSKENAPAASDEDGDELLPAAIEVVLETGQASTSMLQRRLKLGYARAARIVDEMEQRGIVGPFEGSKPRQLLITREQWQEMQMRGETEDETEE